MHNMEIKPKDLLLLTCQVKTCKYPLDVEFLSEWMSSPIRRWAESTRLLSGIGIMFSLGLSYYVPMDIMWSHIHSRLSQKWHNWGQIIVRFTMLVILAAVAIGAPEIGPFVGLVGSFGSSTLAILIPVTLDVIFRWPHGFGRMKWLLWKNGILFVFGLFILVAGTYFSVKDVVAIYQ